jgi:hypothetical protein
MTILGVIFLVVIGLPVASAIVALLAGTLYLGAIKFYFWTQKN